jgi:putative membrane protein
MMWWNESGWGAGQWMLMSLLMLAFLGGLVALGMWAVRSLDSVDAPQPRTVMHADDVLAERFARGEIDEEEYTRRRAVLRHGPPAA